jgi:hypothetical protein
LTADVANLFRDFSHHAWCRLGGTPRITQSWLKFNMDAFSNCQPVGAMHDWRRPIKAEAARKVESSPLIRGCADAGPYPRSLFGGFWYFVNEFPEIIRESYASVPAAAADAPTRRFLQRSARTLAGSLRGMEGDERTHRGLWIRAARCVGLAEAQLQRWPVLAEVRSLTDAIRDEPDLGRRLLYFVAVEMVAESMARYLVGAPRFVEAMGEEGMLWFAAHLVPPGITTSHEALAFQLAMSIKRASAAPVDAISVSADIQRCVDWFQAASIACAREVEVGAAALPPPAGARPTGAKSAASG